ncbi:sulfite exporter TauE/SafE family protein [Streptomyces platensis]|uniref:Probable membrane transporter protein n=1 Tax=Streptomyces platensis TaxID=58346 RepID=A0AAE6NKC9_STRPT|nr:sulfite exporter TauE/SafE family protein [Streptomyces platensis]OSY35202.1 Sulfite exporter TauE/SafE [Streptomyces platensis]QEV53031.1 sulfite exporter TauE/SafE family protein [Streptomyces platensis]
MSVLVALAALPCGLLIGLLLGALGGGGSVLAVPALVYLLGQSPHEATAGALVVVTVGAVTGLLCHGRAGRVRWAAGAAFGALGTAGSYLGSRWSAALDPTVLMAAFSGLLLVVAAMLVLRGRGERRTAAEARPLGEPKQGTPLRDAPEAVPLRGSGERDSSAEPGERDSSGEPGKAPASPEPAAAASSSAPHETLSTQEAAETLPLQKATETAPLQDTVASTPSDTVNDSARPAPPRPVRFAVTASAVGLLTGFFGVGGGFVVVPALTLVLGLEMPVAIGTSLLVILINSLTALATRAGTGALDWPLLAGFAACAALGSHLGNRLTTRLRPQVLATAFACLVTVLAVIMAATALPRLW